MSLIEQLRILPASGFDYIVPGNPTTAINPRRPYATWLNTVSGEIFVCRDNTSGANEWIGQDGTWVGGQDEGLTHWYPLIANANDYVGNKHGTAYGTAVVDDGAHFQGVNGDRIFLGDWGAEFYQEYSVSLWGCCFDGVTGGSNAFHLTNSVWGNLITMWFHSHILPRVVLSGTDGQPYVPGKLHHLVQTRNTRYLDGVLDPNSYDIGVLTGGTGVNLGCDVDGSPSYNNPMRGTIKDVRIYNKILSQEEVTSLFLRGPAK